MYVVYLGICNFSTHGNSNLKSCKLTSCLSFKYVWEQLYNTKSAREIGTLYNLRQKLRKNNVYADVKKNYKAAAQFMSEVTAAYICESFMQWTGLENLNDNPPNIMIPSPQCTNRVKENFLTTVIGKFVDEFVLPELDIERNWKKEVQQKKPGCDEGSQCHGVTYAVYLDNAKYKFDE